MFAIHIWVTPMLLVGVQQTKPTAKTPPKPEMVMTTGMKITATTKTGTITITAGMGYARLYTWEGATRGAELSPRNERWYGSLGASSAGYGDHWQPHNGIARGVLEEGRQHFKTEKQAIHWLREGRGMPLVYRDDGLVVAWDKVLERKQLGVEVWQVYINGKKPHSLPGSNNSKIVVTTVPIDDAPLLKAVFNQDARRVQALLDGGADPNLKTSIGNPILMVAAQKGNASIVQALLDKQADPNARNPEGATALIAAVETDHVEAVRVLLAHGANVDAAYQMGGLTGTTPLMLATMNGNTAIVEALIARGAKVQAQDASLGTTPLHNAADTGNTAVAEALIKNGSQVDVRDWIGRTPLMSAAMSGKVAMVRFLIAKGARVTARDDNSRQMFAAAQFVGDKKMEEELKKSGKLDELHEDGRSVLDWARIGGNKEIIKILIAAGAKE